jgi:hypothetical protein
MGLGGDGLLMWSGFNGVRIGTDGGLLCQWGQDRDRWLSVVSMGSG